MIVKAPLDCPIVIGQYDNVSETATINSPLDERILDELVPPPGPRWRRALLWVAFLGIVVVSTWAFTSGTVTPRVSVALDSSSGSAPLGLTVSVQNNSWVSVEVVGGPRPRPGLSLIGYTTGGPTDDYQPKMRPSNPFPVRLGPRESIEISAWYRVTDCQAIAGIDLNDDVIDLQVRIADGPASWITAERSSERWPMGWSMDHPEKQSSWAAGLGQYVCTN